MSKIKVVVRAEKRIRRTVLVGSTSAKDFLIYKLQNDPELQQHYHNVMQELISDLDQRQADLLALHIMVSMDRVVERRKQLLSGEIRREQFRTPRLSS